MCVRIETSSHASANVRSKRDNVVLFREQRREDRWICSVEFVAITLPPNIQLRFSIHFRYLPHVLVIFYTPQHSYTFGKNGAIFLKNIIYIYMLNKDFILNIFSLCIDDKKKQGNNFSRNLLDYELNMILLKIIYE